MNTTGSLSSWSSQASGVGGHEANVATVMGAPRRHTSAIGGDQRTQLAWRRSLGRAPREAMFMWRQRIRQAKESILSGRDSIVKAVRSLCCPVRLGLRDQTGTTDLGRWKQKERSQSRAVHTGRWDFTLKALRS